MFFPSAAQKFPGKKKFLLLPGNFWAIEEKILISFSFPSIPSAKRCPNQLVLINYFFQHNYAKSMLFQTVFSLVVLPILNLDFLERQADFDDENNTSCTTTFGQPKKCITLQLSQ